MKRAYKCLSQQEFAHGRYKLIPIRDEDKYAIMIWRNEQIDILRQKEKLTKEKQELYFSKVVNKSFEQDKPEQLLFSFLEDDILIGYGGLVHIDWESKNAEISFLTATERNSNQSQFSKDWGAFLEILKRITDLQLHFFKIYTYAYNIRPKLYHILHENNFTEEARLKKHIAINGKLYDVLIHSYFIDDISFRMATKEDVKLYYKWTNDEDVRNNSFNKEPIKYDDHCKWFFSKLSSGNCCFYLFFNRQNEPIGQVRIENAGSEIVIGISVAALFRGKSLSSRMLIKATDDYLGKHAGEKIIAYIKHKNIASYKSFTSAGFTEQEIVIKERAKSYKLLKKKHD